MMNDKLTDKNFQVYAWRHYGDRYKNLPEEFIEDLKRVKYIKKLITRYIETGELKERLILNHIIVLRNVFGPKIASEILLFKMRDKIEFIKPFLEFLSIMPDSIEMLGSRVFLEYYSSNEEIKRVLERV